LLVVTDIYGGHMAANGGVVAVARGGGATSAVFAAVGAGFRLTALAPTSGHRNAVGRAAGGVAIRVVIATGADSLPDVAPCGTFSGGAATSGSHAHGWHQAPNALTVAGGLRAVAISGDMVVATDVVVGTTIVCVDAGWRVVVGIRRQTVATSGAIVGVVTNASELRAHVVGSVVVDAATSGATSARWHKVDDVVMDVGGLCHAAVGDADVALAFAAIASDGVVMLLLNVLMMVGGRFLVFVGKGLQLVVLLSV
jgi:hypothetical protein